LPLEDLPVVGQFDKKAKAMMHGDEGIGVDWLKELDPGPYTHDGIHIDDIMEHGPSPIHYELLPLLPVTSNHVISAFQQGHQPFPLVKIKTTNGNTYVHTYHFCKSFGGRTWLYTSHHSIMGRNWYVTSVLVKHNHMTSILMWNYLFCILYFVL
jgi:hypothetical protein